jgi:hypothetical protein
VSSARISSPRSRICATQQRALVDAQLDHRIERQPLALEKRVERLGLRHRARKPVEDETVPRVRLVDALGDDADHDVVGHQPAAGHDVLRLEPDRRSGGDCGAQHIPRGKLNDAVLLNQPLRLRSLARPRRPEKDQSHLRRPLSFDLRISPSY